MSRQDIQKLIISYLGNFKPEYIGLFGSFVREDDNMNSDIDIIVKFKDSFSLLQLIKIETELSDKIGKRVDLVTEGAIKNNRIKQSINRDLKIIYRA